MTPTFRRHAHPVGRVLPMDRIDAQFWAERDRRKERQDKENEK